MKDTIFAVLALAIILGLIFGTGWFMIWILKEFARALIWLFIYPFTLAY